jgi:hypothetical protein
LAAYGEPTGQSKLGAREILNYAGGQVTLENGRVLRVDFRTGTPKPAPAPSAPAGPTVVAATPAQGGWLTEFDVAAKEATRRQVHIFAWFAGSEWSPTSRQFQDEVALDPDFIRMMGTSHVLLRINLPEQSATRDPNARVRERHGVTVYPTVLLLSASGENLAKIDVARPRAGESYRNSVIAVVRETHELLGLAPLPAVAGTGGMTSQSSAYRPVGSVTTESMSDRLLSAGWGVVTALGSGLLATVVLFWLVWRSWARSGPPRRTASIAERIAEASSGLPPLAEVLAWPKERVVIVAAGLAEAEGFLAQVQPSDAEKDIVLRKIDDMAGQGFVCCAGANAGVITLKRVRELVGLLTAEGAAFGWYVAPLGFTAEAYAYAAEHRIRLIDANRMLAQLHELPPVALPKLTQHPWARI